MGSPNAQYSDNPQDNLEAALLAWKPGTADAEQVANTAMRMAGIHPPFEGLAHQGMMRVAQDMIDNDPRNVEGE